MSHEDDLYGLLKAADAPETNEDESTVGTTHLYEKPKDRSKGDIDAPWGEKGPEGAPGKLTPQQHSDAVDEESEDVRQGLVGRSFDSSKPADAAEQELMAKNFAHVASGNFTTHSLHLQPKMKVKRAAARTPTLAQQVVKVAGRF